MGISKVPRLPPKMKAIVRRPFKSIGFVTQGDFGRFFKHIGMP